MSGGVKLIQFHTSPRVANLSLLIVLADKEAPCVDNQIDSNPSANHRVNVTVPLSNRCVTSAALLGLCGS